MSTIGDYINAKRDTKEAAGGTWWSEPEAYLADALRRRGLGFRQQVRVGGFVLDFLVEGHLCVEVDGRSFHDEMKDYARDNKLRRHAILTMRFPATTVMRRPDDCVSQIANRLFELRHVGAEAAAEARAKFCPDRAAALARIRAERTNEEAA